jgi:glutaredoxin
MIFFFVSVVAFSEVQAQELYRWVDREGNVYYTETPPDPSLSREDVKSINAPEEAAAQKPQIAVYGRDACGLTRRMMSVLDRAGVPYTYGIIDNKEVARAIEKKMRGSGIDTKRYNLPVVDVGGRIYVRPDPSDVVNMYKYPK